MLHELLRLSEATLSTTSIRVEQKTHAKLAELSESQHRPMATIVAEAVARYDDDLFWEAAREGYERMNADPEDRAEFDAEISAWDVTLNDGLEDFPYDDKSKR
jgi:predicted DNA-binding protein